MRIVFDSQIFAMQKHGGISRYICNLAQGLSLDSAVNVKVVAPLHINAYLSDLPSKLVYGQTVPVVRGATKLIYAANLALSWSVTKRFQPSVVHQTYYLPITYAPKGARRVVTVHDMIHERFADVFSMNRSHTAWKRKAVFRADHVICISECTRRDLLEIFNVSADKVSVAHLGFDRLTESMHPMETTPDIGERPYILYVGQRSGYKNFSGFLRAFASSEWLRRNFGIICFGGGSLQADERRLISELGIPQYQVNQTGGSDGKLAMYYRSAAAMPRIVQAGPRTFCSIHLGSLCGLNLGKVSEAAMKRTLWFRNCHCFAPPILRGVRATLRRRCKSSAGNLRFE
jgi:glycosyltransferase involved in cell wall biosynthesis